MRLRNRQSMRAQVLEHRSFSVIQRMPKNFCCYVFLEENDRHEERRLSLLQFYIYCGCRVSSHLLHLYPHTFYNTNTESSCLIKRVWFLLNENCKKYIAY
ncbi:hypothetical protein ACS0PU_012232 [Formica fusca]